MNKAEEMIKKYEQEYVSAKQNMKRASALRRLVKATNAMIRRGCDIGMYSETQMRINRTIESGTIEEILKEVDYIKGVPHDVEEE